MLRKLALVSAASVVAMGVAFAQQPTPPSTTSPSTSPSMNTTEPSTSPSMNTTPSMSQNSTSSTASPQFIAAQKPDQWLASKFKGTDVLGSDNQKVGDIADLLFDKAGKIEAYVVSVGGFLGIGSKEVALAPNAFEVVPGDPNSATNSSPKLKIAMNKDELKAAPNFEPYKEPSRATTGSNGTRPAPGGTKK